MNTISKLKPLLLVLAILLFANAAKSQTITISSTLDDTPPSGGVGFTATTGIQNGRVSRSGGTSTCAVPKAFPGILDAGISRRFDAYTFVPTASQCVTVTFNLTTATGNIQVVAYDENGFNPVDISDNYLADSGLSTGNPPNAQSFSFNVRAGVPFTIVVFDVGSATPVGYTFTANIPGASIGGGGPVTPTTINASFFGVTTTNQLVRFNSNMPGTVTTIGTITGLQAGENILGIDFRPLNGQLYALGSTSRLYTIDLTTGAATQVGAQFATLLNGTNFGFDFNPVPDRIRIISDTGQNLRVNPIDGTVIVDTPLNPGTPSVTAAGYTNSISGATTTQLFVIDTGNNTLNIQNPANSGTLTQVGPLGVMASGVNGFDIIARNGTAFAALTVGGTTGLYTINLQTGMATNVGNLGGGISLRGLAAAIGTGTAGATNVLDFTGDRRADYVVFRPSNNFWYINPSSAASNLAFFGVQFGDAATDILTPGDYDGDGRTDIAVWRRPTGTFFVLRSSDNVVVARQFGQNGDEPVARDYDGDRRTDYAVVRRANGVMTWFILNSGSNNSFRAEQFGADTDVVAPGDYDGDGRFDLAVFRGVGDQPATFFVRRSSGGDIARQFGIGSDLVVPGDYDGDGRTDFAVVRTGSAYFWFILRSSDNSVQTVQLGSKPDLTTQNDYDGDGRTDVSVYRQQNSTFYVTRSSDGVTVTRTFGVNGDYPVANYDTH